MAQEEGTEPQSVAQVMRQPFGERLMRFMRSQVFQGLLLFIVIYAMLAILQLGIFANDSLFQIGLITLLNVSTLKFVYLPPLFVYVVWSEFFALWPKVRGYLEAGMRYVEQMLEVYE